MDVFITKTSLDTDKVSKCDVFATKLAKQQKLKVLPN